MKVALIAGARPNFMKIAPLVWAMKKRADVTSLVIHTGQHFDDDMSRVFFEQLELPDPDVNLNVGPASHAAQTARVMAALEPVLIRQRPDWVAVVGDVNSTLAGALVAAKLGLPLCHVEAGLRSGDRSMPEEINRLATDAIADLLFAPSRDAVDHLRREGHPEQQIVFAGNVMVDTLRHVLPRLEPGHARQHLGLAGGYILVTLHRPSNVDRVETLAALAGMLAELAGTLPVVFPVHPRTRSSLDVIWPPGELPAGLH
ncbi:MAG: non-hydrolyzing UDP-N-acetylglucosamine 2-epimerase, partial [Acidobacteriota bacterium]